MYFRMCLLSSSDHVLFYVPFTIASSSINCEGSALPLVCILFVFLIGNMQFMQTSICIRALTLDHLYCWVLAFLVFHIGFLKLNQHCLLKKERERESLWWAVFTEEHSAFTVPPPPPHFFGVLARLQTVYCRKLASRKQLPLLVWVHCSGRTMEHPCLPLSVNTAVSLHSRLAILIDIHDTGCSFDSFVAAALINAYVRGAMSARFMHIFCWFFAVFVFCNEKPALVPMMSVSISTYLKWCVFETMNVLWNSRFKWVCSRKLVLRHCTFLCKNVEGYWNILPGWGTSAYCFV